jgi:hypothetical protein
MYRSQRFCHFLNASWKSCSVRDRHRLRFCLLCWANFNQQRRCFLSPEDGNRSSFRNVVFSSFWNAERRTKSRNPVTMNTNFIHFHEHNFCVDMLWVNYLMHVSAIIRYPHCSPRKTLANVRCTPCPHRSYVMEVSTTEIVWKYVKVVQHNMQDQTCAVTSFSPKMETDHSSSEVTNCHWVGPVLLFQPSFTPLLHCYQHRGHQMVIQYWTQIRQHLSYLQL